MRILAIDTSTRYLSVAAATEDGTLASFHRDAHMTHSSRLIPVIDAVLRKAKVRPGDLDGLALSIGPGSFTGLRIGVTTVKGLAFALRIPVVAVPTLDVIARNAQGFVGTIVPVIDAKKKKVYAALYASDGKDIKRVSKYLLLSAEELAAKVKGRALFLGDGADLYMAELGKRPAACEFGPKNWFPRASVVAELAIVRFRKKELEDAFDLTPLYLYSKECDIKGR